ncbi:unnamed protein product, partial [Ascophyllum nodosum]
MPHTANLSLGMENLSGLTRDGTAEPVSRDQLLWRELRRGNIHLPCSADHKSRIGNLTRLMPQVCCFVLLVRPDLHGREFYPEGRGAADGGL